jgi:glycosyltransferase involved in cell wall biosynthesis
VRRYLKLFDHIIPVSNSVQTKLLASGVPQSRMTVAKAGTPGLVADGPIDLGGGYRVGSFGRLVKEKGLLTLIRAAETSGAQIDLFGSGPQEPQLRSVAGPNVTFRGFLPNVANAMSAVDVVAIPSIWDEAFPYSALEAMSLGKPIVASDVGGIPEVVTLSTGRLVPKEDIKALSDAISELSDPDLRKRLGDNARELHRAEYTVERMAERIAAVYGTLTQPGTF